jgi:hypothetical protein
MLKKLWLNLQLFGEGGDGGDGSSAVSAGDNQIDTSGEKIPASIPEKAKKYYQKAMEKTSANSAVSTPLASEPVQPTNEPKATTEKIPYADLIKSDDYKEEHKAYMDKTIGDRLKKYKGIEEISGKQKAILDIVASKYGVNPDDENFLEVLQQKIDTDDSYVENYAMEHDISNEEARRILNMERKVARMDAEKAAIEAEKAELAKQEQMRQQIMLLRQNAEKTKSQFPQFDLDTEMQDERFRKLCAVNNGDTTAAYMACHWNEILPATVQMASRQIQAQTAQAVASNKARPIENGLSSSAPSVVEQDFSKMNLKELRRFADEQRRKKTGR